MTNSTSNPGAKVGRARRSLGQLWQVPTFLIGLLAFIGVAASAPWRPTLQSREFDRGVRLVRVGLDQDEAGDMLVEQSENLLLQAARLPGRSGEAKFLAGSAYYRQAQQKPGAYAKELWSRAAEYLEDALALGVAASDMGALRHRLGVSLYQQNKQPDRVIELLTLSVDSGAEPALPGYRMLVQAHLKQPKPDVEAALSANLRILDLTPEREAEAMAQARLQHAALLLRKDARGEAVKALVLIGPEAPRALRIQARLLQARCCEDDGLWSKAIAIWQELLADAAHIEGGRAKIYYSLGWCHHQSEPADDAETIRAWTEAMKHGGVEGQAAGLRLGLLRLGLGDKDTAQALADWKSALANVQMPEDFRNPYIEREELKKWFDQAILRFFEAQDPQKNQEVAELYRRIERGGAADFQIGQAAESYAQQLEAKLKEGINGVKVEDVQAQYRRAAEAFEQSASARPEAERPDALWRGAQCYLAAKETTLAQQALAQFVKLETNEARLAEAWYRRGELYRADGLKGEAHDAYVKCMQYPNTAFAFRSRYFLAVAQIDNKEYEKALSILKQNENSSIAERPWQEKSLFKMASLLMLMKNYGEAHFHLKECLIHFSEGQNALLAREQLGECCRSLAEIEGRKESEMEKSLNVGLPDDRKQILEDNLRHHRQKRRSWLTEAAAAYQTLADELESTRARTKQLTSLEQELLRRARFGLGECLLDNKEHAEALRIFKDLQINNRRTLVGLYASLRICNMPGIIGAPEKEAAYARTQALESLRLVTEDLKALPAEHEVFRSPGAYPRDEWLRWADATQRKLLAPPKTDTGLPAFR